MRPKGHKQPGRRVANRNMFVRTLIVTEGTKTEPEYFRHFVTRLSRVEAIGKGRGTVQLVRETLAIPDLEDFDRVWVVFDKDDFEDFNEAIDLAVTNGINVGWSNECFELWIYLHFQYQTSALHRTQYITGIEREVRKHIKDYRYSKGEGKNEITTYDLTQRFGSESLAIENARKLNELHSGNGRNYNLHNPCTTVHLLVEELRHPERILEECPSSKSDHR
ncbi:MAG: RloB domain-containing protein [Bacteroidales bacterium]|nr:RloB domain-containing protein [Bacteroidales bacterium]MBR0300649.1 RloB domain-containing protein [Bacteroidales bacterium]